jgi:membrane protein implicated in regulation of membrane protease activity
MKKGLVGVLIAAVLFALAVYIILQFLGVLAIIAGFLIALGIIAFILIFILLFALGFIIFFAAFYYMIEKKPIVTHGEYTLDMEKGKHEE